MRILTFNYLPEARPLIDVLRALGQPIIPLQLDPQHYVLSTICRDGTAVDELALALAGKLIEYPRARALASRAKIKQIVVGWLVLFLGVPALPVKVKD